jgi:hypothetical protein
VRLSPAALCVLCLCAGGAPSGGSGDALSLSVGILTPVYNRGGLWPQPNATSASLGAPTATPNNRLPVAGAIRRCVASTDGIQEPCIHVIHWRDWGHAALVTEVWRHREKGLDARPDVLSWGGRVRLQERSINSRIAQIESQRPGYSSRLRCWDLPLHGVQASSGGGRGGRGRARRTSGLSHAAARGR